MQETQVWFLGREDPLEKGTATYSSTLAWRIPWLYSPWAAKSRMWLSDFHFHFWASLVAQLVKNLLAMQETMVQFLGQEDLLEKG